MPTPRTTTKTTPEMYNMCVADSRKELLHATVRKVEKQKKKYKIANEYTYVISKKMAKQKKM